MYKDSRLVMFYCVIITSIKNVAHMLATLVS